MTNLFSPGMMTSSDSRFKSNITDIEQPLDKLLDLQGVAYDYNDKIRMDALIDRQGKPESDNSGEEPSEKELQSMADMKEWEAIQLEKQHKMGFIAQEVQKIFPDLVKEDDLGYLAIDYIGLVPVIVEAIKAQNTKIEELESRLTQLEKNEKTKVTPVNNTETTPGMNDKEQSHNTFLYQNTPNPFTNNTEIRYFLPADSHNALLYIYNLQGQQVKVFALSQQGLGSVIIQGSELTPGTYIYSLYSNGKELDSKRMILTR
jgi:hypothetical protein